jgi:glycosyltransferase involved in cell wall biosynthesis
VKKKYISIIIPTYNRSDFLKEAIDSVLKQTWKDFELIIVDDGSTDNTQEILSNYTGKISLISTEHKGPSAARNRGIQTAQGEYIAFLDSDDIWKPDKLKKQMDFFNNNPHIFICQTEEIWIRKGRRVNPRKIHAKHSGWIFEKCLPLCIVSPSSVMLHRRVFDRVGLFDEKMPACEDYDLWLRVTPHYQIHLIDEPLIIKRGGHDDQQSYRIPALDRLRIQALCKVLDSGYLTFLQYDQALEELQKKCSIYGNGCMKRGKKEEGETILKLPDRYKRQ